ncbi:hypothetical protein MKZ38_010340 [Zalerion maritima]|uniref:Uncharacterized protein n=1 Tax=Zalerion maritima TaxID=339359 RepID=A0AAD5S5Y4_9PEZI|nr:hypothetical protein MKZ38_010340 [Zalerion maritima]
MSQLVCALPHIHSHAPVTSLCWRLPPPSHQLPASNEPVQHKHPDTTHNPRTHTINKQDVHSHQPFHGGRSGSTSTITIAVVNNSFFFVKMASSPISSEIIALVSLLVLSLIILLILRYYLPLRSTPAYLLVPVFLAIWLPAGIVLLVPIDLASSNRTDDERALGVWLPDRLILVWWRITYWLTFVLTWFILPILAEYADAGYREPKAKLLYSLRSNGQYNIMVFGSGLLGLIYVFVSSGVSFEHFKGVLMALAYCWGLVLAIYLMGHGLVSIPRRLFRHASVCGRLRQLQAHAPRTYEKMEDAIIELEDIEQQVLELSRRKTGSARDFQDWVEELVEIANLPDTRPRPSTSLIDGRELRTIPTVITEKYLAELTRQLIRARHARSRFVSEWHDLLQQATETQAILDSNASKQLSFGDVPNHASWWERATLLTPYARFILHYYLVPYLSVGLGVFLSVASVLILWSELVKVFFPAGSVIRLTVVHHWSGMNGQVGFAGQVIAAWWILYMSAAALISVTEVKVWRGRALVRRNTAHESAFWYAMQVAKLSVPLSYNFMTFLSPPVYKNTIFYEFMGQLIDLTPLGKWFDYLFPVLILFPVAATMFGLYRRVKRFFGFGDLVEDEDEEENTTGYGTGTWREGRDLIERELSGNNIRSARREGFHSSTRVRGTPVLTVPGRRAGGSDTSRVDPSPARGPTRPGVTAAAAAAAAGAAAGSGQTPRTLVAGVPQDEEEDENFFTSLGHRMKNTFETLDKPRWLQDIGDGIKKPKWMADLEAGNAAGGSGGGSGSGGGGDGDGGSAADFRRWFGGGEGGGRIRL